MARWLISIRQLVPQQQVRRALPAARLDNVSIGATTKASAVHSGRFSTDAASGQTQINYASGLSSNAKSALWMRYRTFGTVTGPESNLTRVSPVTFNYTDNAHSASTEVSAVHIQHAASGSGTTGAEGTRESLNIRLALTGQYGDSGYIAFTPLQTISYATSTQGGPGGWTANGATAPDAAYRGGMFGACFNTYLGSGATYYRGISGLEIDTGCEAGSSVLSKKNLFLVRSDLDAVGGDAVDAFIQFTGGAGATAPPLNGLLFGDPVGSWPFTAAASIIEAKKRGQDMSSVTSPEATINANWGIDFRQVTFASGFIASNGFSVDGSGRVTLTVRGSYANDAAAAAGSVAVGELYRNGSVLMIRVS